MSIYIDMSIYLFMYIHMYMYACVLCVCLAPVQIDNTAFLYRKKQVCRRSARLVKSSHLKIPLK